jgi:hypothetical protein
MQERYRRLGVFYFAAFNRDVLLKPIADSPVVISTGRTFFNNGKDTPTAWEWEQSRVKAYGQDGEKNKLDNGHEEEAIMGGEKVCAIYEYQTVFMTLVQVIHYN